MKTIRCKPGRARRAVRSMIVLLCVLAAYVLLSGMKLTPRAAIRTGEQYYGIYEPTHTVTVQRIRVDGRSCRVYLTAGKNTLYCGAARLTLSGWDNIFMGKAIVCADGESVHAGSWCTSALSFIWGQELLFGRIDDPDIALLTIEEWGGRDRTHPAGENGELRRLRTINVEGFIEDGGYRYFLLDAHERAEGAESYAADYSVMYVVGCDASGREILRCEVPDSANGL